ncbi:nuclear transport factor 2 family protein [Gordonia sp. (in: high G+C Gram-positive bacteria)]|uniref:nuclear transport factor 2 family protein n=1 Tax=Gordonia sp. (in: high G+C Gram-positive bacteria) TaxID=84139 RepID=UPI003C71E111
MTTASNSTEERLATLEARLRSVEDRLEITDVIYRYGPAVDAGSADDVLALFTDDGVYDVDTGVLTGSDEIAGMVSGRAHQGIVHHGCSHVMSAPQISIDGDAATVISYSQLILRNNDDRAFTVLRSTANFWKLTRTDAGWRVSHRTARKFDGSDEVLSLLRSHSSAGVASVD